MDIVFLAQWLPRRLIFNRIPRDRQSETGLFGAAVWLDTLRLDVWATERLRGAMAATTAAMSKNDQVWRS
ncbi:MAG TPA: hypothetical protein VMR88_17960, partial [Candidatus Polarisedimenticolaceae bacterium]|nr:hypothetical protein [Candidatus Polarisedimenticolaceae bacterium]